MNRIIIIISLVAGSLTSACTTYPVSVTSQITAGSMEKGESTIAGVLYPRPFIGASAGITDQLDMGADLHSIPAVWSKYTFIERPSGFAVASVLGLFSGEFNVADENRTDDYVLRKTKGGYVGMVASWEPPESALGYVAEVKYANSQYNDYSLNGRRLANDGDNHIFHNTQETFTVSSGDLEHVVQTNFYLKWQIIKKLKGYAGIQCLNNVSERNQFIASASCSNVIGLSVTR